MSSKNQPAKSVRHFLRFRLWHVLFLTTLIAIPIGVYVELERRVARQEAAIQIVESFGWSVETESRGQLWLPARYQLTVVGLSPRFPCGFVQDDDPFCAGLDETTVLRTRDVGDDPFASLEEVPVKTSIRPTTRQFLSAIARFDSLESIDFSRERLSDKHVVLFNPDWPLRYVNVASTALTEKGMQRIGKYRSLETLYLEGNHVDDEHLRAIRSLSQLKSLWLDHTLVTDAGLMHLRGLTNLKTLYIESAPIRGSGLKALTNMHELRSLWLSSGEAYAKTFPGNKSLFQFASEPKHREMLIATDFPTLPKLRSVTIEDYQLTDGFFLPLARQPALEDVSIFTCYLKDDSLRYLADSQVKKMTLSFAPVEKTGFKSLARIESLKSLGYRAYQPETGDKLAAFLLLNKSVTTLTTDGIQRTDELIDAICDSPQLTDIEMQRSDLTKEDVDRINDDPQRFDIDLSGLKLPPG